MRRRRREFELSRRCGPRPRWTAHRSLPSHGSDFYCEDDDGRLHTVTTRCYATVSNGLIDQRGSELYSEASKTVANIFHLDVGRRSRYSNGPKRPSWLTSLIPNSYPTHTSIICEKAGPRSSRICTKTPQGCLSSKIHFYCTRALQGSAAFAPGRPTSTDSQKRALVTPH